MFSTPGEMTFSPTAVRIPLFKCGFLFRSSVVRKNLFTLSYTRRTVNVRRARLFCFTANKCLKMCSCANVRAYHNIKPNSITGIEMSQFSVFAFLTLFVIPWVADFFFLISVVNRYLIRCLTVSSLLTADTKNAV